MMSVIQFAPSIIAGSAVSAFGFSIGRDVYRKAKKYWPVAIVLVCLIGIYYAGVWIFRNYRTTAGTIFKKSGALIVLAISCGITSILTGMVVGIVAPGIASAEMDAVIADPLAPRGIIRWLAITQITVFLIGALVGMKHRKRRRLAWEAEDANVEFLADHGLEIVSGKADDGMRLRDHTQDVGYRLTEILPVTRELEFVALGRRNKRGYMNYDETGKYTAWSGLSDAR